MDKLFSSMLLLVGVCAYCLKAMAEDAVPEYVMKSTYLYNFAMFTNWPESTAKAFNVCIAGQDPFGNTLNVLLDKQMKGKPINVARISNLDYIKNCHVLYFSESEIFSAQKILTAVGDAPVLTITDNSSANGFMIRMSLENQRLIFDIDHELAQKNHLSISSKLLRLSRNARAQ